MERFTDGARAVVYLAIEDATELGRESAGVEHVLLGLVGEEEGLAGRVLRSLGVTVERVRGRLLEIGPPAAQGPSSRGPFPLPFTPQAERVLELALREAVRYGSRFVGTEHVLLGLVGEQEGGAVQVLRELDLDVAKIPDAIAVPPSGLRTVVGEPGGPLVVRVSRSRGGDRPEGGGERAKVEQDMDERAGEQPRIVGPRRLTDRLEPAAAGPCVARVHATVKLESSMRAELAAKRKDDRAEPDSGFR
ncbi:MAG: Clp protease N-terminal domain-containing protein [Solirubrobacteraceae bacterium]